jgi:hypothetical protein
MDDCMHILFDALHMRASGFDGKSVRLVLAGTPAELLAILAT